MLDLLLYTLTVLIWGASWLAIKYQLGVVAPEVSLVYRFALAAVAMVVLCVAARRPMRFPPRAHLRMAALGLFLFSTKYVLIYLGSQHLTSGLVAVAFSTVVAMNILLGALLFRVRPETYSVFSTSWKGALARKRAEGDAGASSRGVDAAGASFQLALREPCVRAPVRRTALVMLQHHGGRPSCRDHEHKALKTRYMSPDGLLGRVCRNPL